MQNKLFNKDKKSYNRNNPLKETALMYLKESLNKERYEECSEMIKNAKRFGAQPNEIAQVIREYTDQLKLVNQITAYNKNTR